MARQVQVLLVDDLDGGDAVRNVSFSFEGDAYEIDLSQANYDKFEKILKPYIDNARKVKSSRRGRGAGRATGSSNRAAEIREWARSKGMKVSERGRVSAEIVEAYEAAH